MDPQIEHMQTVWYARKCTPLKLLHLIDWEGVQSFIDHSLGEVLSKTGAMLV